MMANCLIVDDEPLSRDVLRKYIGEISDLNLVAECHNAFEATHQLNKTRIDILFLDINMPGLSGISFARSLTTAPLIVFTTAYPEYAVEGFELDATDYLVKPYSFERFLKAVNRALERLRENHDDETDSGKILIKADKKIYALLFSEILFLEGQGDYIRIRTEKFNLMVHDTIKNFLTSLPEKEFMRIHKSYVINLKRIEYIEGNQVSIGQHTIPVSPVHREELLTRFSP
ncbi:MAG: response regulator transcription factor [Candidatus Atribacteria bacterium]|nr:MAG: response regulator transcription factor [Candidatus Atribacteria bacterium]